MGWAVLLAAAGAAAVFAPDPPAEPSAILADAGRPAKASQTSKARGEGLLESLPARETIGQSRGELFSARSWAPPPAPVAAASPPAVNPSPTAPPVPYRVAGEVVHDGAKHLVLARGDTVHVVREGASLEGGYRVESIRPDRVTLLYEPLGTRDYLAMPGRDTPPAQFASSAAGNTAAPAQLRWEGPERVHAGKAFNVALKLTSDEPLRASPLQLNFDATLLEPIEVRAGRYFSDGSFSYRVNPAGSIFIGASGKGSAAADAELLVVSFKPIRPGATELQLSSVLLQGAAGRAIAHAQPAAFRTAILQ